MLYDEKDFWNLVDIKGEDNCWTWKGSVTGRKQNSYGRFRFNRKIVKSHRLSYELMYGNIPEDLFVLHSCDNKLCCNPKHLHLGTHRDNMNEAKERGRVPRGENSKLTKLKNENIIKIRELYDSKKYTNRQIGKLFDISKNHVSLIVHRKIWTHI